MKNKLVTNSITETQELASNLAEKVLDRDGPVIIGLIGNLGSGKTTFTQGFIKSLGISDKVISPTFILIRSYDLAEKFEFKRVVHLDLYRLESQSQVQTLGLEDYFSDPENIILIEWADRLGDLLPKNSIKIYFEVGEESSRFIQIQE